MLVLSRQREEVIVVKLGDEIVKIKIVDIRGDKVRLGITAPRHIRVHREEVYEAIELENKAFAEKAVQKAIDLAVAAEDGTIADVAYRQVMNEQ